MQARPQKRYDDTSIIMIELVKHGYSSTRGAQMIARMNAIHGGFAIRQEDYVYVLTSFMFEPIRWNARFGPDDGSGPRPERRSDAHLDPRLEGQLDSHHDVRPDDQRDSRPRRNAEA